MVPSWAAALPRLLLLLLAPFHVRRLSTEPLLNEVVTEGLLIEDISDDCRVPSALPARRLHVINATLDVLSTQDGISLKLDFAIDEHTQDAWNNGSATVLQIVRTADSTNAYVAAARECRTLLLRRSESLHVDFQNPIRLLMRWLHTSLIKTSVRKAAMTTYSVTATTFSQLENAYVDVDTALQGSVFINSITDWPKLAAVHMVRSCNHKAVRICFSPNDHFREYTLGLCDLDYGVDCAHEKVISAPATSVVFYDVKPSTYEVLVSAKQSPGNCYCGEDSTTGDCIPCGNSLARAIYTVSNMSKPKPSNNSLIARTTYRMHQGQCCVLVTLSRDELYYFTLAFNVTIRDAATRSPMWSAIVPFVSPTNVQEVQLCGSNASSILVEGIPTGNCFLSYEPVLIPLPAGAQCPEVVFSTWIIVTVVCTAVTIVLVIVVVMVVIRSKRSSTETICAGTKATELDHEKPRRLSSAAKTKQDINTLFGGSCPVVLILYSNDNDLHVRAVLTFAKLLRTYGQFRVIIDRWCDPESVQIYGWLGTNIQAADKIVVIASEGVRALHTARRCGKIYSRHATKYPFYHHVTDALDEAGTTPEIRRKLVFVNFPHSSTACVQSLCACLPASRPCYRLPDEMSLLVGVLHDASSDYVWSCLEYYKTSQEIQDLQRLLQKMQHKVDHHLKWMSFGPLEDALEWPNEHAEPRRNCQRASLTGTVAHDTIAVTVACSGSTTGNDVFDSGLGQTDILQSYAPSALPSLPLLTSAEEIYDETYCSLESSLVSPRLWTTEPASLATVGLRTEMPAVEEIWETYFAPEPSPRASVAGSLTSAKLRAALQRLNSNPRHEHFPDDNSNNSAASCITLGLPYPAFSQDSFSCANTVSGTYASGLCESPSEIFAPLLPTDK